MSQKCLQGVTHSARPTVPPTKSEILRNVLCAGVAQDPPFGLRTSPWEESWRVILLGRPGLDGVDEEKWPA